MIYFCNHDTLDYKDPKLESNEILRHCYPRDGKCENCEHKRRTKTRSDILQGQALFRGVKQLLIRGVW